MKVTSEDLWTCYASYTLHRPEPSHLTQAETSYSFAASQDPTRKACSTETIVLAVADTSY